MAPAFPRPLKCLLSLNVSLAHRHLGHFPEKYPPLCPHYYLIKSCDIQCGGGEIHNSRGRRVVGGAGDTPQHGTELVLDMASQLEWRKTLFFLVEGKHKKQDGPKKQKLCFFLGGGGSMIKSD